MNRPRRGLRRQIPAAFGLVAALSLTAMACSAPPAVRPDIVLVTLDTVRADRLGTFGGDPLISPNLDRLARRGRAFSSCDAASPLTLPSHATILTGLYPPAHGLRSNGRGRLPASVPTLAQQFQDHGYATAAFVSSVILDHGHGLDGGFSTYDDQVGPAGERRGDTTVDAALSWWRSRPRRQPAFIWVHLFDAHAPYRPPSPWAERFPGRPYEGEIAFMDAQVGRLLDGMSAAGEDLVVAVAGDHGEGLGEHGEKEHGLLLYQSTLAVPCILVVPGLTAGGRTSHPVRTLDLMPTLLARAGIAGPKGLGGLDLLAPAAEEPAATVSYAETLLPWEDYGWHPLFAARRGPAKLQQGAYTAYHDLDRDPQEVEPRLLGDGTPAPAPILAVAAELTAMIDRIRHSRPASTPGAGSPAPGATLEQLRSLGYLAGSAKSPPVTPIPGLRDPRDQTSFHGRVAEVLADYRDGRSGDAARALSALLGEEPGNPFLRDLAGSVEMARGNPAAAADHFAAALNHTPDRGAVEIHLAEALLALGQAQEAEMRARHALGTLPDPPPLRAALTLCQAMASQGRRQEARQCAVRFLAAWEGVENPLLTRLWALAEDEKYP
jgi:hypothetical protein